MNLPDTIKNILSRRPVQIGLAVIAVLLLLWALFRTAAIPVETKRITKGTYEQVIEEDGISRVRERFTLFSPVSGILRRVEKHAGDRVKKGEVLAIVDWDSPRQIRSPIDGTILQVERESGGPVAQGSPILDVGDTTQLEIMAEVLTQEAVALHARDEVIVQGWGGGDLKGHIRLIEPSAFKKVSSLGVEEQRVRVLIDFDSPSTMGEGYRVHCRLIAFRKEDRLLLPTAAMFRDGEDWAVFRVEKGKALKTKIVLEASSGATASVQSGLAEGSEVILYPGEAIQDGVSVQPGKK